MPSDPRRSSLPSQSSQHTDFERLAYYVSENLHSIHNSQFIFDAPCLTLADVLEVTIQFSDYHISEGS